MEMATSSILPKKKERNIPMIPVLVHTYHPLLWHLGGAWEYGRVAIHDQVAFYKPVFVSKIHFLGLKSKVPMSVGVLMRGPPGKELQGPLETESGPQLAASKKAGTSVLLKQRGSGQTNLERMTSPRTQHKPIKI